MPTIEGKEAAVGCEEGGKACARGASGAGTRSCCITMDKVLK